MSRRDRVSASPTWPASQEDGRITEAGTHDALMAARGHYYDLYRQQSLQESSRDLVAAPDGIVGTALDSA